MGPVASQEAIKELGTNGGGFFNANSAHPFENPTPLSNFLEILLILLIPAALTYTFGIMVGNTRQGWALLGGHALSASSSAFAVLQWAETSGNPLLTKLGRAGRQHGGQGGPLRPGRQQPLCGGHHRHLLRGGQQPCTTPSPPSAAWCRSA